MVAKVIRIRLGVVGYRLSRKIAPFGGGLRGRINFIKTLNEE